MTILNSSGNVGIGTASPQSTAHISDAGGDLSGTVTYGTNTEGLIIESSTGSTGYGSGVWFRNAGLSAGIASTRVNTSNWATDLKFYTHPAATSNQNTLYERMVIDSDGNVGIGTPSPTGMLQVVGSDAAVIGRFTATTGGLRFRPYVDAASGAFIESVNAAETAYLPLRLEGSTTILGMSGNVGIGTASPAYKLEVNGTLGTGTITQTGTGTYGSYNSTGSGNAYAQYKYNGSTIGYIGQGSGIASPGSDTDFGIRAENDLIFTSGTYHERMRIDSSGNVGIGTTAPTEKLDINSDAIRIRTASTPASATATGAVGEIRWDSSYMYVCTATNTWKRSAISTW